MEFNKLYEKFKETYILLYNENQGTDNYNLLSNQLNEYYLKLIKLSQKENKLFTSSPIEVYSNFILSEIKEKKESEIIFDEIEYLKKKLEYNFQIRKLQKHHSDKHFYYHNCLNKENYSLFKTLINLRIQFIEKELYRRGYEVILTYPYGDTSYINISYKKHPELIEKYNQSLNVKKENKIEIEEVENFEFNESIPYKIALLKELGFFELESIKRLTKESQYKIISKLTGGTIRAIKGNVLVLNPKSDENRERYTSNNYIDIVKLFLDKLK